MSEDAKEMETLKQRVQELETQLREEQQQAQQDANAVSISTPGALSAPSPTKSYKVYEPGKTSKILGKPAAITIPFNKPCLFPECGDYIQKAFEAGKLSGDGLNSQMCTDWFAERFGYNHSLLTPSCTAALEMAALLLDLGPGDEVIVPSFTFVSTANAFALRGVKLVFGDSGKNHPNMSIDDVLSKITPRTKAIVLVHYAGAPIDITKLQHTGIPIVEDCAHAIGTYDPYTQDYIGKTSAVSTFSFHETKNVGIGEGGLLVVNDEQLWEKAQIIREKGTNRTAFRENRAHFYTWYSLGSSYLLSDVDAGILMGCLEHFDEIQDRRLAIWDQYDQQLIPNTLYRKPQPRHKYNAHMYFLQFHTAVIHQEFNQYMKSHGILVTSHYRPLDQSPFVQEQQQQNTSNKGETASLPTICHQSEKWSQTLIRLPLFYGLSSFDVNKIIRAMNDFSLCHKDALTYRPAEGEHYDAIRIIRNQHRECFWQTDEIDWDTHVAFMDKHAASYRVAVDQDGEVAGFIGVVKGDLRLATRRDCMRTGIAQFLYENCLREFPNVTVQVKRDNPRSLAFFQKNGWTVDQAQWDDKNNNPVDLIPPPQ